MSHRASIYHKWLTVCVVVLFMGAGYGCTAVQFGKEFDSTRFEASVEIGVTTGADVRTWLGDPVSTGIIVNEKGERFTRWVYYFGKGRLPSLRNSRLKMLEVRFDHNHVVRAYNWSST
ncbi:MAG: hypothetical protein V3V96_16340 [Acidiferrobacterales bacterium]